MLSIISKGGKWEGNNWDFPFGREKGSKLTFSFPFLSGKGNPIDPCLNLIFFLPFLFKKSLYIPIMPAINSNSIFMQQLSVFTKYFCKTT